MKTVYFSLGSNLGEREENLHTALARLEEAGVRVSKTSSVYETEPMDVLDQPWFLNIAAQGETELFPKQLLSRIHKIERAMGRKRKLPKGPRIIDIDILFYGEAVIETETLTVPHPRMDGRRFVLEPMAEIAPELRHPVTRRTMREMLAGATGQVMKRKKLGDAGS